MRLTTVAAIVALSAGTAVVAQTAGPQPTLIYTYEGQSVDPSILTAISTAGDPARSLLESNAGPDTATGLVPPFPTTATLEPVSAPPATTDLAFSSGQPGVVLSSVRAGARVALVAAFVQHFESHVTFPLYLQNTRAPFIASGTIDTSRLQPSTSESARPSSASSLWRPESTLVLIGSVGVGVVGALVAHLAVF
ncbi:hypothetical protein OIO90_003501 [Microbotryomycetes sp. JL221]|nr:hypothetical protein OIO90_003501 [Microbotryomycetes sp. JL221]